jgi:hypothetical protein
MRSAGERLPSLGWQRGQSRAVAHIAHNVPPDRPNVKVNAKASTAVSRHSMAKLRSALDIVWGID